MTEPNESAPVSQVDQIGEIFSDYTPVAKEPDKKEPDKVESDKKEPDKKEPDKAEPDKKEPDEKEPDKVDEKDTAIKDLLEQVRALSTKVAELSTPKKEPEPKKEEPVLGLGFFKDKAEYEEAFSKPEVMSEVMGRVETSAIQKILKSIPQVINNTVKAQIEVQTKTAKFYTDNEDLITGLAPDQVVTRKSFIGYVANDLSGKNPDWTLAKLFEELPGEVKKRIGLKEDAKKEKEKKPGFTPPKKGGRVPEERKPELTTLESEIQDLM